MYKGYKGVGKGMGYKGVQRVKQRGCKGVQRRLHTFICTFNCTWCERVATKRCKTGASGVKDNWDRYSNSSMEMKLLAPFGNNDKQTDSQSDRH